MEEHINSIVQVFIQNWDFFWVTVEIWSMYQMDWLCFCCCSLFLTLSASSISLPVLFVPPSLIPVFWTAPPFKCQENVTLIILHETSCPIMFFFLSTSFLSCPYSDQLCLHLSQITFWLYHTMWLQLTTGLSLQITDYSYFTTGHVFHLCTYITWNNRVLTISGHS